MDERRTQPLHFATNTEIYHNARVKLFPRVGVNKVTYCSSPVFRESGWEKYDPEFYVFDDECHLLEAVETREREIYERGKMGENVRADSLRRAKMRVFEYAMLNEFEFFVTWTLDRERINRYDPKEVSKKMQTFLRNKVNRNDLRYIIVPELHKDGAIHAHGFVTGNLKMVNSGKHDRSGRVIYNVKDWKYGFTTAVRINGDYQKACYYITKYIEKADKMIFGNFYYAGGKDLVRNPEVHLFDAVYTEIEAKEYPVEDVNISFKYEDAREDT